MRIIAFILIHFLISVAICTAAQNESGSTRYGIYADYGLNFHNTNFPKLFGIPNCCPKFESGSGLGFDIGLIHQLRIQKNLYFTTRLSYGSFDGLLETFEPTTIIVENEIVPGEFKHSLEGIFHNVGIEPLLQWNFFDEFNLFGGFRIAYSIKSSYSQKEEIFEPKGYGTFIAPDGSDSHTRIRNQSSGDIPNSNSLLYYAVLGISYDLPLNLSKSLFLSPQINFHYGFNSKVRDVDWHVSSLKAGLAIKYSKREKRLRQQEEILIDTIFIPIDSPIIASYKQGKPNKEIIQLIYDDEILDIHRTSRTDTIFSLKQYRLEIDADVVGVDYKGKEIPNPVFVIEEEEFNIIQPLLPYIFFDENSSEIPNRYIKLNQSEIDGFSYKGMDTLTKLQTYYHLLNIIGKRMRDNPKAKLTVTGCNADFEAEKSNNMLSEQRAQSVINYLIDIWGISATRLRKEARNLPSKPSTPYNDPINNLVKIEENRRVELSSDNYNIIAPIFINDTIRKVNPPIARFKPTIVAEAGLKKWNITAYQDITSSFKNLDTSFSNYIYDAVDWNIESDPKATPRSDGNVIYRLSVQDVKNTSAESGYKNMELKYVSIYIKRLNKINDIIIDNYSLILFDFDDYKITGSNKLIVDLIKSRLSLKSIIRIEGFTDLAGEFEYNRNLSSKRAEETSKLINHQNITIKGIGEIGDNNHLPEGRFYCRTVDIIVDTPVE